MKGGLYQKTSRKREGQFREIYKALGVYVERGQEVKRDRSPLGGKDRRLRNGTRTLLSWQDEITESRDRRSRKKSRNDPPGRGSERAKGICIINGANKSSRLGRVRTSRGRYEESLLGDASEGGKRISIMKNKTSKSWK